MHGRAAGGRTPRTSAVPLPPPTQPDRPPEGSWRKRLQVQWREGPEPYWWQDADDVGAQKRTVSYVYLEENDYQQYRDAVLADRVVAPDGSTRWRVHAPRGAYSSPVGSPTAKDEAASRPGASPSRLSTGGAGSPIVSPLSALSLGDGAGTTASHTNRVKPGAKPGAKGQQERVRRRPPPLPVKTHSQLLGEKLRFEDAQEDQVVRMTPYGCKPTLATECLYTGTILKKEKDFITVLWHDADEHGPPEKFGNPPRADRERQEPKFWWNGLGNPVLGELSEQQKFRQKKMRKEAKEAAQTRKALLEPRPEHEKLREKHQFQELRQSRDDFLVVLGGGEDESSARIFKRRHITTYGALNQKEGFATPADVPYRPLGERTRKVQTRVKDLTSGLRYPPQTMREQRRRQERMHRPAATLVEVTKQAVHQRDTKDRRAGIGRGDRGKVRG
eukprot:Hpha_TRINITY_DN18939_c0_g1::TRINITY_DN18939_c0_g1_i1::g.17480::m.17480